LIVVIIIDGHGINIECGCDGKEIEMKTVVLNVNDQVVDKLMWFLGHFNKEEIDVLDESFLSIQAYLQHELDEMESGAVMINEKEFWQSTEEVLSR